MSGASASYRPTTARAPGESRRTASRSRKRRSAPRTSAISVRGISRPSRPALRQIRQVVTGDFGIPDLADDVQPAESRVPFAGIEEAIGVEFQAPERRRALAGDEQISVCEQRVNSRVTSLALEVEPLDLHPAPQAPRTRRDRKLPSDRRRRFDLENRRALVAEPRHGQRPRSVDGNSDDANSADRRHRNA